MRHHVGFTGTRTGLTLEQRTNLRKELRQLRMNGATVFHHGDCIGADAEAHDIAKALGFALEIHPPSDPKARAYKGCCDALIHGVKPYLDRNCDIVDAAEVLVACPSTRAEQLRSGTWATVRYARKTGKILRMVMP